LLNSEPFQFHTPDEVNFRVLQQQLGFWKRRLLEEARGSRSRFLTNRTKRSQSMSLRVNRNFLVALPAVATIALSTGLMATPAHGQELPSLINVVDYTKLLPLLPEAPAGWTADKPNGSTTDVGGFKLTNVHRDYRKGEGDNVPTTAISILDSAANPDYVEATTAAWKFTTTSTEGYSKSVNLDGHDGFETFENEGKHGTLWLMVAKRYFVQIETQGQDPAALQEWAKRVDIKKLATIK
jgi:hypothetical protein